MPRINLLPWREQQRTERKKSFLVGLGAATVGAAAVAAAGLLMFNQMIDAQRDRNDVLRAEIKTFDKQIEEINSLESKKAQFVARMQIIEKLQRSRPEIVYVFDTFVKAVPDGTYLTSIVQSEQKFKIQGVAQSSTRVSSFMRNIDGSEWLKNPELEVVQSAKESAQGSNFTLNAQQITTLTEDATKPAGSANNRARRKN
jgi:type IV pilus assembly protein PilN